MLKENSFADRWGVLQPTFPSTEEKTIPAVKQLDGEGSCCWQFSQNIPGSWPPHVAAPGTVFQDSRA